MTTLLIARHGNTFGPNDIPTRVGARTDLDLVASGQEQAQNLAAYLKQENLIPDIIFTSHLKRTIQMADIICNELGITPQRLQLDLFNEIDYGPDENKPEEEVIARIGEQAIKDWDDHAKVPDGWDVDPQAIKLGWQGFAQETEQSHTGKIVLVVTSNGIARFAPYLTGDFETFKNQHKIKMKTGALSALTKDQSDSAWQVRFWNMRP